MRTPEAGYEIAVLVKMAQLLDVLANEPSLTPSELSTRLGMPRTTVHRIVQTLVGQDMLTPTHEPGPRLIRWSQKALHVGGLRTASGTVLDRLVETFGETASIFVRSGSTRTCIARREGTEAVRHNINVGASIPIHVGSAGRILLAWLDNEERETLVHSSHGRSGVPVAQATPDWAEIRQRGWARTAGERDPVLASVSVPVFGPDQRVVAALSLSGPRMRFSEDRIATTIEALKHAAVLLRAQIEVDQ
ncbi:MAG: IclR family transcriptional regulator [Ferrimicrobium sp.]